MYVNVATTPIHEMSHAGLEHLYRQVPRVISEVELSTYMKGWLDNTRSNGTEFVKENLDKVMNNTRWLINEISWEL